MLLRTQGAPSHRKHWLKGPKWPKWPTGRELSEYHFMPSPFRSNVSNIWASSAHICLSYQTRSVLKAKSDSCERGKYVNKRPYLTNDDWIRCWKQNCLSCKIYRPITNSSYLPLSTPPALWRLVYLHPPQKRICQLGPILDESGQFSVLRCQITMVFIIVVLTLNKWFSTTPNQNSLQFLSWYCSSYQAEGRRIDHVRPQTIVLDSRCPSWWERIGSCLKLGVTNFDSCFDPVLILFWDVVPAALSTAFIFAFLLKSRLLLSL